VSTAADSIVQYAQWVVSGEARDWRESNILREIRDYNQDDCISTAELARWLRSPSTSIRTASRLGFHGSPGEKVSRRNVPHQSSWEMRVSLRPRMDAVLATPNRIFLSVRYPAFFCFCVHQECCDLACAPSDLAQELGHARRLLVFW
jgi:hypothetical protein